MAKDSEEVEINNRDKTAHKAREAINKIVAEQPNNKLVEILKAGATKEIIIPTGSKARAITATGHQEVDKVDSKGQIKTPITTAGRKNN